MASGMAELMVQMQTLPLQINLCHRIDPLLQIQHRVVHSWVAIYTGEGRHPTLQRCSGAV
jgi:hypothetical protein